MIKGATTTQTSYVAASSTHKPYEYIKVAHLLIGPKGMCEPIATGGFVFHAVIRQQRDGVVFVACHDVVEGGNELRVFGQDGSMLAVQC